MGQLTIGHVVNLVSNDVHRLDVVSVASSAFPLIKIKVVFVPYSCVHSSDSNFQLNLILIQCNV